MQLQSVPVGQLDLAAAARFNTTAGAMSVAELVAGCDGFELHADTGRAAYALRQAGQTLWIMAAAGRAPGVDLTAAILHEVERVAIERGATQIAATTIRPGLVHKLQKAGFQITGITLRKNL